MPECRNDRWEKVKLKYTFEIMELDDQKMAVPVGDGADEFHGILKLNTSAAAIFELLKEDTTEDAVIAKLLETYDIEEDELKTYVHEYIEELKGSGFVE